MQRVDDPSTKLFTQVESWRSRLLDIGIEILLSIHRSIQRAVSSNLHILILKSFGVSW